VPEVATTCPVNKAMKCFSKCFFILSTVLKDPNGLVCNGQIEHDGGNSRKQCVYRASEPKRAPPSAGAGRFFTKSGSYAGLCENRDRVGALPHASLAFFLVNTGALLRFFSFSSQHGIYNHISDLAGFSSLHRSCSKRQADLHLHFLGVEGGLSMQKIG